MVNITSQDRPSQGTFRMKQNKDTRQRCLITQLKSQERNDNNHNTFIDFGSDHHMLLDDPFLNLLLFVYFAGGEIQCNTGWETEIKTTEINKPE